MPRININSHNVARQPSLCTTPIERLSKNKSHFICGFQEVNSTWVKLKLNSFGVPRTGRDMRSTKLTHVHWFGSDNTSTAHNWIQLSNSTITPQVLDIGLDKHYNFAVFKIGDFSLGYGNVYRSPMEPQLDFLSKLHTGSGLLAFGGRDRRNVKVHQVNAIILAGDFNIANTFFKANQGNSGSRMLNFLLREYNLRPIHDKITFHARGFSSSIDYICYSDNLIPVQPEIELPLAQSDHIALCNIFSTKRKWEIKG